LECAVFRPVANNQTVNSSKDFPCFGHHFTKVVVKYHHHHKESEGYTAAESLENTENVGDYCHNQCMKLGAARGHGNWEISNENQITAPGRGKNAMNMTDKPEQPAFARRKMLPKPSARAAIN
jgi:hypothetical protein